MPSNLTLLTSALQGETLSKLSLERQKEFVQFLKFHQMHLVVFDKTQWPPLQPFVLRNMQHAQKQQATKKIVDEALQNLNLSASWFKGQTLSKKLYKAETCRYSSDLDLLCDHPQHVLLIARTLTQKNGFVRYPKTAPSNSQAMAAYLTVHKDLPLIHPKHTVLELHTRVTRMPLLLDNHYTAYLRSGESAPAYSTVELLYLAYHGASTLFHRLKWAYDIHLYLTILMEERHSTAEQILEEAKALDVERALLFSWQLCHELFKTQMPSNIANALQKNKLARFMAKRAQMHSERCAGKQPTRLYRLERRAAWYFCHTTLTNKVGVIRHLLKLRFSSVEP